MDRTREAGGQREWRPFEGLAEAVAEAAGMDRLAMKAAEPLSKALPSPALWPAANPPSPGSAPSVALSPSDFDLPDPVVWGDGGLHVVVERAEAADDAISELHSMVESLRASNERAERSIAELRSMNEELRASNARAERSIAELRSVNDRLEVSNAQASADAEEARRESDRSYHLSVASFLVSFVSLVVAALALFL